jgi:hypothetical protein
MQPEQIEKWKEHPVTEALRDLVNKQIEALTLTKGDAYHPFQPERTQEFLANLNGAEDTWYLVAELLAGDWSLFDEEESDE